MTFNPLSRANLTTLEAGSTPTTSAPSLVNGSKRTPSLQPISNIFLLIKIFLNSQISTARIGINNED